MSNASTSSHEPVPWEDAAGEDLRYITEHSRLRVLDLNYLMDVPRKTIRGWLEGEAIAPADAEKLKDLSNVVRRCVAEDVELDSQDICRKLPGGLSIVQRVRNGDNIKDLADSFIPILAQGRQQWKHVEEMLVGTPKRVLGNECFGSPHYREDL